MGNESEEALVRNFENVGLDSNENQLVVVGGGGRSDCKFFARTGWCKFGSNCMFNHPINQVGRQRNEGAPRKSTQIPCKYYLKAGGCKNGESCRFKHSAADSVISLPGLNSLGLPIRLGEEDCSFYMRTSFCLYGAACRFHHPDLTAVGDFGSYSASLGREFMGSGSTSEMSNIEYFSQFFFMPLSVYWSCQAANNEFAKGLPLTHEGSEHQLSGLFKCFKSIPRWCFGKSGGSRASKASNQATNQLEAKTPPSLEAEDIKMKKADFSVVNEEKKLEIICTCELFCTCEVLRRACLANGVYAVNNVDLPIRPDRDMCPLFLECGLCNRGVACKYNHPEKMSPPDYIEAYEWDSDGRYSMWDDFDPDF